MPLWRGIGKMSWVVRGPHAAQDAGDRRRGVGRCSSRCSSIPWPYELSGKGTLEPVDRQDIFAGVDGVVEKVEVQHGQHVKKGDLLLVLRNDDLEASAREGRRRFGRRQRAASRGRTLAARRRI